MRRTAGNFPGPAMIVSFGSINVDLVVPVKALPRPGETVLGPSYTLVAGGKGGSSGYWLVENTLKKWMPTIG